MSRLAEDLSRSGGERAKEDPTRLGKLTRKADSFDPLLSADSHPKVEALPVVYRRVWDEARKVRESTELLELAELVQCPVVAIYGDYDSHPAEGVKQPLSQAVKDFTFIQLEDCGHTPWIETRAKDRFYAVLEGVLG